MSLEWHVDDVDIDWNELSALYRAAPLGEKHPDVLQLAFSHSLYRCFVFDDGVLVGVGRALADGVDCSYICDVAVLPAYQGRGIGREIVASLVERSRGHKKIILYAYPGKEPFYEKLGFKRMLTAMAIFEDQRQAVEWGLVSDD